ncbi:CPK2 [Symbiodinium sp. CCMP2456]|nr:CPK2 [Symbiodinium sp. CCMP2456]
MTTVAEWEVEDVAAWVERSLQLPCAALFVQANIDGPRLVQLDEEMLLQLGLDDVAHITCLLDHISVLRLRCERALQNSEASDIPQVQDGFQRKLVTRAGFRTTADDRADQGKLGAFYPRVGSPLLCEAPRKHRRPDGMDVIGKDIYDMECDASNTDAEHHVEGSGTRKMGPPEVCQLVPVASQSSAVSGGISTTCSTAAGSGVDGLPQGQRLASVDFKHQPSRPATHLVPNTLCPARPPAEALSRSSSVPSGRGKRGPSQAAADGASLFLSDQSKGAHFGTMPRDVEVLPQSLGPGPARYDSSTAAFKTSGRVSFGMPKFNAEPRRTMEGMYVRGWSGPGVGKYNPPLRSRSRGGSFTRAARWGSRSAGGLPGALPSPSPGPMSYKPNHAALSTVH